MSCIYLVGKPLLLLQHEIICAAGAFIFCGRLEVYGIIEGQTTRLQFEGGVTVEGEIITGKRDLKGKIILITFKNCRVTYLERVLFDPSWGVYDMAIGKHIRSAFAGPADSDSFEDVYTISDKKTAKISYSESDKQLHILYEKVSEIRTSKLIETDAIAAILDEVINTYPSEWLLLLELYELVYDKEVSLSTKIHKQLLKLKQNKHFTKLIADGLDLIIKK